MNFKPELLAKVLAGEKTQTRRPPKVGDDFEYFLIDDYTPDPRGIRKVTHNGRSKWEVGKDYAAAPGRGKHQRGRIMITRIRTEDVRYISHDDVLAEGFTTHADFFKVWCGFYDPKALNMHTEISKESVFDIADRLPQDSRVQYLDDWAAALRKRDAGPYKAWALTFELVKAVA